MVNKTFPVQIDPFNKTHYPECLFLLLSSRQLKQIGTILLKVFHLCFYWLGCVLLSVRSRYSASSPIVPKSYFHPFILSPIPDSPPFYFIYLFSSGTAIICWPTFDLFLAIVKARVRFTDMCNVLCSQLAHPEAIGLSTFPVRKIDRR